MRKLRILLAGTLMLGGVARANPQGQGTPSAAEVQAARQEYLGCTTGDHCHHPMISNVRRVNCRPEAGNRARCRFQERIDFWTIRHPRWQRTEAIFVRDSASARWQMDCRTQSEPNSPVQIIRCN